MMMMTMCQRRRMHRKRRSSSTGSNALMILLFVACTLVLSSTPTAAFSPRRASIHNNHSWLWSSINKKKASLSCSRYLSVVTSRGRASARLGINPLKLTSNNGIGGGEASGWTRRKWIKGVAAVALLGLPILTDIFERISSKFNNINDLNYPVLDPGTTDITIVFHGSKGQDENTDALMHKLQQQQGSSSSSSTATFMMDWVEFSQDTLQTAYTATRIGHELARRLLANNNGLKRIHMIGISVGAMGCDATVSKLRQLLLEKDDNDVYIQETLLDPFCSKGIFDWTFGEREFGTNANYAVQYLNTDDPVPFTNTPLATNCVVYDVTPIRPPTVFGHDWPLVYFTTQTKGGFIPESKQLPRGSVVVIDS